MFPRCHRRGIACEQPVATRKRKARSPPPAPAPAPALPFPSSSIHRLGEQLEDLVSLLRSQAVEKQAQALQLTPLSSPNGSNDTPPVANTGDEPAYSAPLREPDVVIDTTASVVHLLRPSSPVLANSPVFDDVSTYQISERTAEEQLDTFRSFFITMFPFVHIPSTTSASELRRQKPFLWLVIMGLATKSVSQQFAIDDMIWRIISQRIVSEHLADIDLLLGLIAFASWCHYFKKDKPFMTMLAQLAVSLASELNLHKDVPANIARRDHPRRILAQKYPEQRIRTLEERRTILAVFHLTSSTWTAYRKTEPLRWTGYLDECLRVLGETGEEMDRLLIIQIKCRLLTNQLTCASATDDEALAEDGSRSPSVHLTAALLGQLDDIQRSILAPVGLERIAHFYLYNARLTINAYAIGRPITLAMTDISYNTVYFRRLRHLDLTLAAVESWLTTAFPEMPLTNWIGMTVDIIAQFMQCVVVLFKLTTLHERNWDPEEVKKRLNVFDILDHASEVISRVPGAWGIVDADGPRRGLLFKTSHLLQAIKTLFMKEMASQSEDWQPPQNDGSGFQNGLAGSIDAPIEDEFLMSLWDEPWVSDILEPF
ncbi:hypothetical protein F4861DRAFT_288786 [Xylaria intraflava]|nr:hypothetical protein F4861DRAFT_288786 [Xylaria intraflava]